MTRYDMYKSFKGFNISSKYILSDDEIEGYLILFTKEKTYEKYLLKLSLEECLTLGSFFLSIINIRKDIDYKGFFDGYRTIEDKVNETNINVSVSLRSSDSGCIVYLYNNLSQNLNLRIECDLFDCLYLGNILINVFIKQHLSKNLVPTLSL